MNRNEVLRSLEGFMAEARARANIGIYREQAEDDLKELEAIYKYVEGLHG